jgi:hypothetical protein
MEAFINGGRESVTRVIYPGDKDLGIEVFSQGGKARVESIDIWQMASIWPDAPKRLAPGLKATLATAKVRLEKILPPNMRVSRAELLELDKGKGILLHASPTDTTKAHPSFAIFLWPQTNPKDIAYETGEGAHTFRRIGSSQRFRIYYSDPSGFMKKEIQKEFCTKEKR